MISNPERFETGGHGYRIVRRMDCVEQLEVARLLAPVLGSFSGVRLASLSKAQGSAPDANATLGETSNWSIVTALADGFGRLNKRDTATITAMCLLTVQRDMGSGTGWTSLWNRDATDEDHPSGRPMFDDITLADLLKLLGRVLMSNLGDFGIALSLTGARPSPTTETAPLH